MMNDKMMNSPEHDNEAMARKLNQIAEQTQAGSQFAARLEEGLRASYRPQKIGWFRQVSPALR